MKMKSKFLALCLAAMLFVPVMVRAEGAPSADLLEPVAPKHAVIENGRVEVFIGTTRSSDYQIGDSIPIRLVFILTPEAQILAKHIPAPVLVPSLVPKMDDPEAADAQADTAKIDEPKPMDIPKVQVEGLKMGLLNGKPSDVEPIGAASVHAYIRPDHSEMVVVSFYVTTYVTTQQTQVDVVADYMYATTLLPDGQPNWQSASTPALPIGITTAATANQALLVEGDLSPKISPIAPLTRWLVFGSLPFALPMLAALFLIAYRGATRGRTLSKNEATWLILDAVVASAGGRFGIEDYRQIFYAIREHFDVLGMDTTQTLEALGQRDELTGDAVDVVFNQETLFFDPSKSITADQQDRLMAAIGVLIPRH
jgi:hypothetical protein